MHKVTVPTLITNGHFNKEKTLAEMKRSGAQRIALAITRESGYEFSSPENLALLKDCITYFKENGLETLVWIGETMGHDGSPADGTSPYTNVRYIGQGDVKTYCPADEKFLKAVTKWVIDVADCGAEMIMLDDDFRFSYRGIRHGCCCPLHMEMLEKELGEPISEEELIPKIFDGGKNRYRDAWLKTQGDSVRNFFKKLRAALDEKHPEVRLSFCCCPSSWDPEGYNALELAKIMAGSTRPFLRITGAPYWVSEWENYFFGKKTISEVIEITRTQMAWCKDEDIELMTEGDTYPRPRFTTPAAYLEALDMVCTADDEEVGCLKYMLDYVSDPDYETGYIDAAADNQKNYQLIHDYFSDKACVGVRPYNHMNLAEEMELDCNSPELYQNILNTLYYASARFTTKNSLPTAFDGDGVNIVFGENARHIPESLLKNGSILDLTAAKLLIKRGIDVGIDTADSGKEYEKSNFADVPQEYYVDEAVYTRLDPYAFETLKLKDGARVLSYIGADENRKIGVFSYENKNGQRFCVLPFDAEKTKLLHGFFGNYARRRQMVKEIEWLGKKPLDAYMDGDYPECYLMVKKNADCMAIGLWNLYPDKMKNTRVAITVPFEKATFLNCEGHTENGAIVLDSILYPYEFAAIELKLK